MPKNASIKNVISITTAISFSFAAFLPCMAKANPLAPLSFQEMYILAQQGNVQALRASVRRGMNIDVMTPSGDTGLCIAAKRRDSYTYNAFRAAGANPRHPCTQSISHYDDFVESSDTVSKTATPREALGYVGKESFSISPTTWWIVGGLAAVGAGVAIVAGHGGGGGSHSGSGSSGGGSGSNLEEYGSLGANSAKNGKTLYKTTGSSNNSSTISVSNTAITKDQVNTINLISDVMNTTGYLYQGLLATNGGTYTNNSSGILELGTAAVGMTSVKNSQVINEGYIKADSANATIGMIASENSIALNYASGINSGTWPYGIDLNFAGDSATKTVIGMYADTTSKAINYGDIRGTATKVLVVEKNSSDDNKGLISNDSTVVTTAIKGNIIGMEAMILNAGKDLNQYYIYLENYGSINLSAGDAGSTSTTINLTSVGMGSFLDEAFLNGSKNINRAENVTLTNNGEIKIGYTGKYQAGDETPLRKGTGGIVGMRADANTYAVNNSTITLTLADYGSSGGSATDKGVDTGAAMQSVHGANLLNSGAINVIGNASNNISSYGMLAVEGTGSLSGLYTNTKQVLQNDGVIKIEASNSYGMASYNGGSLINNNNIIIGKDLTGVETPGADTLYINNIGMYGSGDSTIVSLTNNGTIDVFSYKSYAMKNDFSGGQEIRNDKKIYIHSSATDSKVFGGYYSKAVNNGTIIYDLVEEGAPTDRGSSDDPFETFNLNVKASAMTTKSLAESNSSTTETLYNNQSKSITLNGSSFSAAMSVETMRGQAENNGTIYLNESIYGSESNGTGMYADANTISSASIVNNGNIITDFYMSAAMASASAQNAAVINKGYIETNKDYSIGMYSNDKSVMKNMKEINIKSNYSVAMYTSGASDLVNDSGNNDNRAVINVGNAENQVSYSYAMYSKGNSSFIRNNGIINIYSSGAALFSSGEYSNVYNDWIITGYLGTAIKTTGGYATVINSKKIEGATTYGILTSGSYSSVTNTSDGIIGSDSIKPAYGIYASGANSSVTNNGTIYASSAGIYAEDTANISSKNIYGASQYGIYLGGADSSVTNSGNIGTEYDKPTYGIYTVNDIASLNNNGTIYASYAGISATGTYSNITNSGEIYANAYGIYANAAGNDESTRTIITNSGIIGSETIKPDYGIYVTIPSEDSLITVTNAGTIYARYTGILLDYKYELPEDEDARKEIEDKEAQNRNIHVGEIYAPTSFYYKHIENTGSSSAIIGPQITLMNTGLYSIGTALDFDDPQTSYAIGQNGTYQAPTLTGRVMATTSIVQNGFDTTYTNIDSFVGEDNGIKVVSESYMFDAAKAVNDNGNTDVVMTMKSFDTLTDNASLAGFLAENYASENGEAIFQSLKTATNSASFNSVLNNNFGLNFIPNLAKQNLDNLRIVDNEINDDLMQKTNLKNRHHSSVLAYRKDVGNKDNVSGYKDDVVVAYGFEDFAMGNNLRAGFGLSATRFDSDYRDSSTRYNNILEIFAPISLQSDTMIALLKPKAGFGRGHYRRNAGDQFNKAKTKEYYYGFDSAVRHSMDLGAVVLEPGVGASITGMYADNGNESNNGLRNKSKNIVSALGSVSLDVEKEFELNNAQSISLSAGGKYYHEFGNKYTQKVSVAGMDGLYKINSNRFDRDFGLLSLKAGYKYKQFTVQASAHLPLEDKHNTYYLLNLGYMF